MHLDIKTAFDRSDALNTYIEGHLLSALASRLRDVHDVVLRLSDANGPRHGAKDKIARISARLRGSGRIVITATSADIYRSVDRVIDRFKSALRRRLGRTRSRRLRSSTAQRLAGDS